MPTASQGSRIAVVGGGLIGSAAARHLAEAGHSVTVFAPGEPQEWSKSNGPFASHYDAGRITRVMAGDSVWAELAARSIARYADIEQRSGISFHDPRGLAWIALDIEEAVANAVARGANARQVTREWLLATAGIRAPSIAGLQFAFETGPAGVVNPRQLVAAQLRLCEVAGGVVDRSAVTRLVPSGDGVQVSTTNTTITADRVLIAAGTYGADLVNVDLDLDRHLRTTVRIDLGPAPEMPSVICEKLEHPHTDNMYWNPPVRYPDGRLLFKIGCEIDDAPRADSVQDLSRWFAGDGDPAEADALLTTARAMLPAAAMKSWDTVPCVITRTPSGYPMIGWVDERVAVAVAGNGSSAKSSDELGRLASSLFADSGWTDTEVPIDLFAPELR